MRRAPRPLAIVLAASTVTLSLFCLTGCEGDEASRADKHVNQTLRTAYASENPMDELKKAADEDKASGASKARAKAMLADAELLNANNLMRQIEQNENQIATLVWELGQLGQSIQTSSRLIEAYRSYDPTVVQQAAEAHVAEVKGEQLNLKGANASMPALASIGQNISKLQDQIKQQQGQLEQFTQQRAQLVQQADEAAKQSENAKGREAVDAFAKASGLRKQAAGLSSQIDNTNAQIARLNADLAVQQQQQQILSNLIKEYQQEAAATDKGFKAVASQEEAQQRLIKDIYGSAGGGNAPATAPATTPATIQAKAAQLAAVVNDTDQLRQQALASVNSAVQHYGEAQQAADDFQRQLGQKMGAAPADAPERVAWEDLKKLVNPSTYQLQKSVALQTLGTLEANTAQSLASRVRLASDLSKTLKAAGLQLPASLQVKDGAAQLKQASEEANKAFSDAADLEETVLNAPMATDSQKASARVAKILTQYAWSNAAAAAGDAGGARTHHAEAVKLVQEAVADNVTLPALPPDIAPAPKVSAAPAAAPAANPAAPKTGTPAATPAPAPAAQ